MSVEEHGHRLRWRFPRILPEPAGEPGSFRYLPTAIENRVALVVIAGIALAIAIGTFWILSSSVDLYFPADSGEYVADARALLGTGVREIRHAPLFPALVALSLGVLGPVSSTQLSIEIAVFLFPISLFVLLRQWLPAVPSIVGASVASLTPMTADLVGWGGGATLIGLDMMLLTLATMNAWLREGGKQGIIVGVLAGLTLTAHPFTAAVTVLLLAVRYSAHALSHRHFSSGWDALGLRGVASCSGIAGLFFLTAATYYLRLAGTTPTVSFDAQRTLNVLIWGTRSNLAVFFSIVLAVALPLPLRRRGLWYAVLPVAAFVVLLPALLQWDITYNLRVVYFLPPLVAIGTALLVQLILESLGSGGLPRKFIAVCTVGLLVGTPIVAIYGFGYVDWTTIDSAYYQRIHASDLPAFDYLATGIGTVATSWSHGSYDEGKVNGWFVEGLSNRPSVGPGAPWTWTLANVGGDELDLQRFFSGQAGIENGALQTSSSTTGHLADPAIQVGMGGFYYPLAYLNSLSNTYPVNVSPGTAPVVGTNTIQLNLPSTNGTSGVLETVQLSGTQVVITYSLQGSSPTVGDWEIWIWPAYFIYWTVIDNRPGALTASVAYRTGSATTTYVAPDPGSTLTYYESHPVWGVQAIAVRRSQAPSVSVEISVLGCDQVGDLRRFDELSILRALSIATVVVWNDTGWMFRFDGDVCYRRGFETGDLVIYEVAAACRS